MKREPPLLPPRPLPPVYKETIVLCEDDDWTYLWLENYQDVLLADGFADFVSGLTVGLRKEGVCVRTCQKSDVRLPGYRTRYLSKYLNVPEVIKFQQAVLRYAINDIRHRRRSDDSTQSYAMKLIFEGLKGLELVKGDPGPSENTDTDYLENHLLTTYFESFTKTAYPRSKWSRGSEWNYEGEDLSLLDWTQHEKYEKEGFVGYFPRPSWVLQEEQTKLDRDHPGLGITTNSDARRITGVGARKIDSLAIRLPGKNEIHDFVDEKMLEKKASEAPRPSTAPVIPATPASSPLGALHRDLERVSVYALRGDTRDPITLKNHKGFSCNLLRKEFKDQKIREAAARVDATLKKGRSPETLMGVLLEQGVLNLGDYTLGNKEIMKKFGVYVSTTNSLAIAKHFSNNFHMEIAQEFKLRQKKVLNEKFNSQNFCYAMHVNNGFLLPSGQETRELRRRMHEFANYAEQEVAAFGWIPWEEVCGFRVCLSHSEGQRLAGPIWLRSSLQTAVPIVFQSLYRLLSGASQGPGTGIEPCYERGELKRGEPWNTASDSLPKRSEVSRQ